MKFTEIKWVENAFGGLAAQVMLKDGMSLSVIAGEMAYCSPRENHSDPNAFSSFEIAIFDSNGEFVTRDHIKDIDDDVKGWVSREEIEKIIEKLSK